uniref:Disks large homolog 5 N-terminal domain-containing protein n=1 Tax=Mus spicilegus TaxID=10103 RepID=A0A8C6HI24_MUSSI
MFSRLLRLFHKENGDQGDTRPRQKESGILSCKKGRRKSFWGRHMSAGKTSSQNCNITNHMKNMNKLEDMKFYIRKINAERLELFRILDIDMNTDLNYRMNIEFTIIKSQHEKTMLDMEKMKQSISDTIEKYKEFIEDNDSYRCEILQQKLEHGTDQDKVSFEENFYRGIPACAKQIFHLIPSNHGYHLLHFPLFCFLAMNSP